MANPAVIAQIADKVLGIVEKFLDPRQYDIVRLKRLNKIVNKTEKQLDDTIEFLHWINDEIATTEDQQKIIAKQLKKLKRLNEYIDKKD